MPLPEVRERWRAQGSRVCEIPGCVCTAEPVVPAERKLPRVGIKSSEAALAEYNDHRAKVLSEVDRNDFASHLLMGDFYYPPASKLTRWLVQLSCGDVKEEVSRSYGSPPYESSVERRASSDMLRRGYRECWEQGHDPDRTYYRTILMYLGSEDITLPVRDDDYLPESMKRLTPTPAKAWKVRLCCGHVITQTVEDLDWLPEMGTTENSKWTEARAEDQRGRLAEIKDSMSRWSYEYHLRRIASKDHDPDVEEFCMSCEYSRPIVAYENLGPLVPPPKPPPVKRSPRKAALEKRLFALELEAQRLREQLAPAEGTT